MAYELESIRTSQEIFYYLLEYHELREEDENRLYRAYTEWEEIQNLVKSQGEIANCSVERYGNVIYLIPKEENDFLGYSKAQLKAALCRSGATDRDYYLSQFVVMTLLVEFYDGQGSSSKAREYMRVGELQNCISARLKEGAEHTMELAAKENDEAEGTPAKKDSIQRNDAQTDGIAFADMLQAYEALRSEDKGSRARTTKEGFMHHILLFLEKQGLVEYVEQDEMIKTTKKLDNFMDWNLLNQNNYQKVLRILGVSKDE
jgi:hypothetical protein